MRGRIPVRLTPVVRPRQDCAIGAQHDRPDGHIPGVRGGPRFLDGDRHCGTLGIREHPVRGWVIHGASRPVRAFTRIPARHGESAKRAAT